MAKHKKLMADRPALDFNWNMDWSSSLVENLNTDDLGGRNLLALELA
jgi:hypothetical protein